MLMGSVLMRFELLSLPNLRQRMFYAHTNSQITCVACVVRFQIDLANAFVLECHFFPDAFHRVPITQTYPSAQNRAACTKESNSKPASADCNCSNSYSQALARSLPTRGFNEWAFANEIWQTYGAS